MSDESGAVELAPLSHETRLAYERTYLGYERTQMAWLRTALSLISFGFAIAKFFEVYNQKEGVAPPLFGPRTVGISMISVGLISLLIADMRLGKAVSGLRQQCPDLPKSLARWPAGFIAVLGILALLGALIRS